MLTLFGGCTNDDDYNNGNGTIDLGEEVLLTLELNVPTISTPTTYALSEADENKLETIDILVFKVDEGNEETYLYRTHATDIDNNNGEISKKFKALIQKSREDDRHRIVLLTNANRAVEEAQVAFRVGMTKAETLAMIKFDSHDKWDTTSSDNFTALPMWGETANTYTITGNTTGASIGAIKLLRSVARIDVGLNIGEEGNVPFSENFKIADVKVYNANNKSLVAPSNDNLEQNVIKAKFPTLAATATRVTPAIAYAHDPADYGFIREIYVGEANNNGEQITDSEVFCIVVGGYYTKDGAPENTENKTWYRIDFYQRSLDNDPQNTRLDILRNHRYKVNITSVNGPGYETEDQAFNSKPVNMVTDIIAWDEGEMNDITTDGQYQLAVDKSKITLYEEGNAQPLKIFTDYTEGWSIVIPEIYNDWIRVTPANGNSSSDPEVATEVEVTASAYPNQTGARSGYFFVKAGRMSKTIHVTQLNEPELWLEIEPSVLTFRKSGSNPKTVTVTSYPTGAVRFLSSEGDIVWATGSNPDTDLNELTETQYQFQPARNESGQILNSSVRIKVKHTNGMYIERTLTVRQLVTDLLFAARETGPYPAEGGACKFFVDSDTPWWFDDVSDPNDALNGGYNGDLQPKEENREYSFTLNGNKSWAKKQVTFYPKSEDVDFAGDPVVIEQSFVAPKLTLSTTTIDFGYTTNPTAKTIKVTSNAEWEYTTQTGWGSASTNNTTGTGGEHKYYEDKISDITINPVKYDVPVAGGSNPTPAAGTSFIKTLNFTTQNLPQGVNDATASLTVKRVVPVHFEYVSTTLASGSGNIPAAGTKMTVKVNTNTKVTAQANFTGGQAQNYIRGTIDAGNYAVNKTTVLDIPANNSWESRTVKLSTWHSGVWNGTSFGSTELVEHATYTQAANYNYTISHTFSTFTVNGGTIKMTYAGNMGTAARQIRAVTKNGSTVTQIGISESSTSNNVHTLNISSVNWGTATRTIYVQYKDLAKNGEWKDYTTTISQPGTSYNVTGPSPSTLTGFEQELTVTYGGTMPTTGIRRVRITNEAGTTVLKTGTSVTTNKPTVTVPENNTGASRTLRIEYWNMGYNNGTGQWLQMTTLDQPSPYYSATQTKNGVSTNVKYIVHKTPIAPATVGTNGVVHTAQMIQADNNCRCRDVYGTGWEMLRMDDGLNHLDDYYLVSVDAGQGFSFFPNTTDKYAVYTSKSTITGFGDSYNLHYVKNTAGGYGSIRNAQTLKDNGIYMWCTKRK